MPRLEALEDRAVPSTATWDGSGGTTNWTDRFNWVRDGVADVAPVSGDDLVFPDSAIQKSNVNNFGNLSAHSITFSGSGYTISGGALNVLSFGGVSPFISNTATTGVNRYNGPIQLDVTLEIQMSSGSLELGGAISGSGHITKTRPGTLTLNGADANTFTGGTSVTQGLLQLDKGDAAGPKTAIPSSLTVFSTNSAVVNSEVRLLRANQIADSATVNVNTDTNFGALLNLNGKSDTIGPLNLSGGAVSTGAGTLTLSGNVSGQAVQRPSGAFTSALITGNLALGANRTFTVADLPGSSLGLEVDAVVSTSVGGVLVKEGTGPLIMNGTAVIDGGTVANAGTVEVDNLLAGPVTLTKDAVLSGNGQASGNIVTSGGSAQNLDDGSTGFTATGWTSTSTTLGFGGDVTVPPSIAATAIWTFTGLTPGLYRVFATWPYDPANTTFNASHSTAAPYSIFDNTTLRTTATIDQEQAPAGGPRVNDGAKTVVFGQLAGAVNITSTTLTVKLSNQVPGEADGQVVAADAVRIERLAGVINPGSPATASATLFLGNATLSVGSTYRVDFVNTGPATNVKDRLSISGSFVSSGAMLALSSNFFDPPTLAGTAYTIITQPTGAAPLSSPFENVGSADSSTIVLADGTGKRHTFTINYHGGDGNDVVLAYQNTATQARDLRLSSNVIDEGDSVTLRGALTDPNRGDVLSLRVDWGDSVTQTFTDLGTNPFHFTHTYADNSPADSPYVVHVDWFDQQGAGKSADLFLTVNNVPPRLFLGGAEMIRAGEVMQHTARFTDPGADTWTATVDYGDGSDPQPLTVQPDGTLLFAHRYQRPGKYRVTVTVLDDDGGLSTDAFLVIVLPLP